MIDLEEKSFVITMGLCTEARKQGREIKSKGRARFRDRIKFRRGRKPPKHHTPGRDHKKYVLAFLIQRLIDSDHRRRDDARFF